MDLPSGGGAGPHVGLSVIVVRRLRTIQEHFKNVVLYSHDGVEEACSALAEEALTHSPRKLHPQGKARVKDGPCFATKN